VNSNSQLLSTVIDYMQITVPLSYRQITVHTPQCYITVAVHRSSNQTSSLLGATHKAGYNATVVVFSQSLQCLVGLE